MKSNRPTVVKRGYASVRIYRINTRTSSMWSVDWRLNGRRNRKAFADRKKAQRFAELTAERLASGEAFNLALNGQERLEYTRAMEALQVRGYGDREPCAP